MKPLEAIHTDTYSSSPIPDGMIYVPNARTREEVLIDLRDLPADVARRAQSMPAPLPQRVVVQAPQQRDPITTRILAAGVSTAAVLVAAGQYAPQLGEVGHALEAVGIGVGVLAGGVALLKGTSPKVTVNLTNNVTGSSSTSSSTSSSAAGWRPNSS